MNHQHIGRRLKVIREAEGLTQDAMAAIMGLNDRQSVSQIEIGERRVSAAEILKVVGRFKVALDDLTNPFLLAGNDSFSWRQNHVQAEDLDSFEKRAGEWIGAYRELSRMSEVRLRKLLPRVGLTHTSAFEDAALAGEDISEELKLGDVPAHSLARVMEEELGILILMVDATSGISGAACRLPELNAVIINRNEPEARRNSDLAHEFFHLLTWDAMKPARIESSVDTWEEPRTKSQRRNQRIEQLADNFASGLLMPTKTLDRIGEPKGDLVDWLTAAAETIGVSSRALKWRLVNANRHPAVGKVSGAALAAAARCRTAGPVPELFGKSFVTTIAKAIEGGHLSGGRAASLLGQTKAHAGDLCASYGIARPVELGAQQDPERM